MMVDVLGDARVVALTAGLLALAASIRAIYSLRSSGFVSPALIPEALPNGFKFEDLDDFAELA